jgi:hypothetical protein
VSSTNRKFVVAYIVLVGIPLLGLAGVLKAGRHLTPPYAVDGSWKLESSEPPVASECSSFLSSMSGPVISVSQSGTVLVIGLNGKTTTGTLEGKSLRVQFPGTEDAAGCSNRAPRTMAGSFSISSCASCSLAFRAVRQPRAPSGGSR